MKIYACDFETTTTDPQNVEIWSSCEIEIGEHVESSEENCTWQSTMSKFFDWMKSIGDDACLYFHNLKFDGSYILDYLCKSDEWKLAATSSGELLENVLDRKKFSEKFKNHMYTYCVTDKNVIYYIKLNIDDKIIMIKDSLKLLPFSLSQIGKSFKTEHQKLEMEYSDKPPGYTPTPDEMKYIYNDVLVLKEGLEKYAEVACEEINELSLTIGSHCMKQYKKGVGYREFRATYPSPEKSKLPTGETYDTYVRRSYHGGWCYLKPEYKYHPIMSSGYVYDVNSLYPSVMHSASGCFYPVGRGHYEPGPVSKSLEEQYKSGKIYFFIRFSCEFFIKKDHLPTVQIKNDYLYDSTEWLTTSTVRGIPNVVTLTMTATDYYLFREQYDVKNLTIIDKVYYRAKKGIFDNYINYWYKIKQTATGALRQLAKLMLNNLYGKFSTSAAANYITYDVSETDILSSTTHERREPDRAVYIPIGSAITSWARNFTIRHAQANFAQFVYADTDSLHMIGNKTDAVDIIEHPTNLCCWKNETTWNSAVFSGQKRYIEHVVEEDCEKVDKPYYNVKCCGMGREAKQALSGWLENGQKTYSDFRPGLVVPGNIKGHRVNGGIFLESKDFTFRKKRYEIL